MPATLLTANKILTLDANFQLFSPGYLIIEDDLITAAGPLSDQPAGSFDRRFDLGNQLVMPGLVNAHTHTPMSLFRGMVEGHTLFTLDGWYNTIRVVEEVMDPEMIPAAVAVSCAEMIRTGTTTFADQYFWMDEIVPVVRESGMRAALAYGIVELGDGTARKRELSAAEAFLASLQGDPLLEAWIGPHAFFVDNQEDAMQTELELAKRFDAGFHIHLATNGEEDRICRAKYGRSAVEQLEKMGMLDQRILAAHCLTVPEKDFSILKNYPFTAVLAVSSFMRNAASPAPLVKLLDAGVNVALGTDNVTNNNSYDMFKEMQIAGKLYSLLEQRPTAVPTRQIIRMATLGGAHGLGIDHDIGSLEPGKKADLITLNLDEIGWGPEGGQDEITALVYSVTGMHVRGTMVDGRWLYKDGEWLTIDYPKAKRELNEAHRALKTRLEEA